MHARPHLARWEHKRPMGPRGPRGNGDISEERFILCIIPTFLVLLFFFNSRILQTGILQAGPNQFVELMRRYIVLYMLEDKSKISLKNQR